MELETSASPAQPTSPPPTASRSLPTRRGYAIGLTLIVIGGLVFGVTVLVEAKRQAEAVAGFERVVVPGSHVVTVAQAGEMLVFYENLSTAQGQAFDTFRKLVWPFQSTKAMKLDVVQMATGEALSTGTPLRLTTYDIQGRQGSAVWAFDAPTPGAYRLTASWLELEPEIYGEAAAFEAALAEHEAAATAPNAAERDEPFYMPGFRREPVVLAVGPEPLQGTLQNVLGLKGAATIFALSFTAGVLFILLTYVRRHPLPPRDA